jgi:DNA modification methylase
MVVAERLGVNCIGIELNPNYIQIAKKRIKLAICQSNSKNTLKIINSTTSNGSKGTLYKPDNIALT